ncbi:MAG: hypothetical protein L0Y73_04535 [Candidatus Aminicenantes bacterium]|nr:hypothetical protein [Candidatus Aminicenantes bacterium]
MELIRPTFSILKYFYENPLRNLKLIVARQLDNMGLPSNQGVTRTVYGVVRKEQLIGQIIKRCSKRETDDIDPDVLLLLKIGIYLLIFSESYPDHAVVNEIVNFSGKKAKNFLNANLRTVIREKYNIEAMIENLQEYPLKYSISDFLIENLAAISNNLNEDLYYLNQEPRFHLRVNTHKFDYEQVKEALAEITDDFKELKDFTSFEVRSLSKEIKKLVNNQYLYVQNTSSQFVSIIASRYCRERVLDCCAAPGTKAVTLTLLRPGLTVIANDLKIYRTNIMQQFTRDFELPGIYLLASDARQLALKGNFDFIIADAPCSAAGTLRKNPDLKLKINRQIVERNSRIQVDIVKSVLPYLEENGVLLYSVCSFVKEETEDVLHRLDQAVGIETVDISDLLSEYGFEFIRKKWGFYLLPEPFLNNDLFYFALVRNRTN